MILYKIFIVTDRWLDVIKRCSQSTGEEGDTVSTDDAKVTTNPLQSDVEEDVDETTVIEDENSATVIVTLDSCRGKLLKQGGMNKDIWQERWCYCTGKQLEYFENATDVQAKGTIGQWPCLIDNRKNLFSNSNHLVICF